MFFEGPKHGGANIKVVQMFEDLKKNVDDWKDQDKIAHYLRKLLNKEAFDRSVLSTVWGMPYILFDPRSEILKEYVKTLSLEKGKEDEYNLYSLVEEIAPKVIAEKRRIFKGVSANVDFYSGFLYDMLDLPVELYTPIFAVARIAAGVHIEWKS